MLNPTKLKPDRSASGFLIGISGVAILGLSAIAFGIQPALMVTGFYIWLFMLYSLIVVARTGNFPHLVPAVYQLIMGAYFVLLSQIPDAFNQSLIREKVLGSSGLVFGAMMILIFFFIWMVYLAVNRKLKFRGREVFELAAESVEETGNGYTTRPRPVGKVNLSRQELASFTRFLTSHLIALAYTGDRQVTFVPVKMGNEYAVVLGVGGSYRDATWVTIDFDGAVSVHIAQKDYLDYQEPLSFDKLCQSLGDLFIEFSELHKRGEGVRVIDRMDALRLGIFS